MSGVNYKKILTALLSLVFITGFLQSNTLMDGIDSAKRFYFYLIMSLIITFLGIIILLRNKKIELTFNKLDTAVILFAFYLFVRLLFTEHTNLWNEQFIIHVLMLTFYFILKNVLQPEENKKLIVFVFLIAGMLQGAYGLLQLYGFIPSNNPYFKITGTFGNPDSFAGYITSIIPFAFGVYLFNKDTKEKSNMKYAGLVTFLILLLALSATQIRGGWFAAIVCCAFISFNKYKAEIKKYLHSKIKLASAIIAGVVVLSIFVIFLFNLKPDSANGRLFIWKVTTNIIKQYPVFGVGYDRFAVEYDNYQADYFASGKGTGYEKKIAGNVNRAHNEYLEIFAESGAIGLVLFILILYSVFRNAKKLSDEKIKEPLELYICAKASFIAILIFSLTSFPFHILPTFINFYFLLGFISTTKNVSYIFNIPVILNRVIIIPAAVAAVMLLQHTINQYNSYQTWRKCIELSFAGNYPASESLFENVKPQLKNNAEFLFNYGGMLSLIGRYKESIILLEDAKKGFTDPNIYISLANSYASLNNFTVAEKYYKYSANMIPHKIYAKYLLVGLYKRINKIDDAVVIAKEILETKEKIISPATKEIKNKMKKLIENNL
ncbi:MAG: O-antigen ligase family protein [Ignavibacteriales bacterium]|nr:O-antigen ligase family protein [Ignavibacteriales bacterium]